MVVPVYRSKQTVRILVDRLSEALAGSDFEIILIDDASGDGTWEEVRAIASSHPTVRAYRLGQNAGQHGALLAGIRAAKFSRLVTLDDDLQNPPEEIPRLLSALSQDIDVVYGVSKSIKQTVFRTTGSKLVRKFFSEALGFRSAVSISSFRAFRTELRNGFDSMLGPNISIDALLTWSTTRFATLEVTHHQRAKGKSNYTIRKLLRFALDMATGYSTGPLRLATFIGFLTLGFGFILLIWVVGRFLLSGTSVPGFPLLASSIIIFSGVQILLLGLVGEYVGRIHFRVMNKPTFVVAEALPHDQQLKVNSGTS